MATVELTDIRKEYGTVTAVDGNSLTIEDGELVTFVGPSGCGKTTTLELIAGLQQPTDGSVEIDGNVVNGIPPMARNIAMVFQNIALYPHMSVKGNMSFPLRLRDQPSDEIDRKVDETAEMLDIAKLLERKPSELSGGQRQRVGIGRAIVRDPDVFLLDEPLANLDAKLRVEMRTEIQRLQKQLETTMVYVTHDQLEAMTISDKIVVMNDGLIQQSGRPVDLYMDPANIFVAGFIGSPSMNFVNGQYVSGIGELTTNAFSISLDGPTGVSLDGTDAESVVLGVRHEDAYIVRDSESCAAPSAAFDATVDLIEPVGEYQFLYLDAELDEQLLVSVGPLVDVTEGESVSVVLDLDRIHVFDGDSGEALTDHSDTRSRPSTTETSTGNPQ